MNYKLLSLIGALLLGCGCAMAQDYEDDIYYDGKNETSKVKVVSRYQPVATDYSTSMATTVTPVYGVVNGRDVDEYNRRIDTTYYDNDTTYLDGEMFGNTRRIERFHNPDVVIRSNDPDLIEYYFDSTPTVNLIVGTDWSWGPGWGWGYRYYDPWYSWNWGWYYPWHYGYWNTWGWYGGYRYHPWAYWGRPWGGYSWHSGWHSGWYRPGRWYGDRGRYHGGINGRRPGRNYHGNRGNIGHGNSVYSAPGRNGRTGRNGGYINHGNIGSASRGGYTGGTGTGRTTMRPGGRTVNRGGSYNGGGRSSGIYNGGGVIRSNPSSGGRSYSGGSRSGGYSGGSRSGGYSGGSRSSGGFSGGSHGGGFSGGGRSGGGGSHGGGGGHGGRR